ncbi:MAG TPA: hypothetical protein VNX68_07465 [Nitrosopumilaceae archaeon]|jgi:phage baseplate assembly protein W|nr:hypothetical protein [Nitrosopumilaceae archaeon]
MSQTSSIFPLTSPIQGRYIRILYLDVNSRYTQDTQQLVLENINAVNNELINLIMTAIGERHFEPEFGSTLPGLIFDQPTQFTTWIMEDALFKAVQRWLPNVRINFDQSIIAPLDNQTGYYFRLVYSVEGITGNISVDFVFST